jgi:hypothetical protein
VESLHQVTGMGDRLSERVKDLKSSAQWLGKRLERI